MGLSIRAVRRREPQVKENTLDAAVIPVNAMGGVVVYDFVDRFLATGEVSVDADCEPRLIATCVVKHMHLRNVLKRARFCASLRDMQFGEPKEGVVSSKIINITQFLVTASMGVGSLAWDRLCADAQVVEIVPAARGKRGQ